MSENQIVTDDPNDVASEDAIRMMIVPVRGVQVMLDRDLAALYGVEVKYLNRQVKRNIERFPSDFMFQLTKEDCLRCQIGTLNGKRGEHLKYMPYAFTENGIAMLSGVLRSSTAIEINIRIMRAFVAMRRVLANVEPLLSRMESVERRQITDQSKNEARFDEIFLEGLDPKCADVVVLAGDVAPLRGRGPWHINDQKKWINKKFREWTSSYPDIQFIVIPGNHDFYPIAHIVYKDADIDWKYGFSSNVHFLGDLATEIGGVRFYGTPWVPIISYSWAFEGEPDRLVEWFSKIPSGLDVLVTHSPPHILGSDVDRSLQTDSEHFGSTELTEAIAEKHPRFVFCGHIHTGDHHPVTFTCRDGSTTAIYNVSRLDERYEIAYEPTWVEV